jgi:AraC family transcriptional regulator
MQTLPAGQFYGTETRRRSRADVILSETAYRPFLRIAEHAHERPYFCFVLDGSFEETGARRRWRACDAARLIFHPAAEAHGNRFGDAGGRCFNIELGPRWAPLLRDVNWETPFEACMAPAATLLVVRLYDEFRAPIESTASLVIQGLVLALVGELDRAQGATDRKEPAWLRDVREYVDTHFRERLSIEALAFRAGVHPAHLSRVFGRHHGMTIGEHVRLRRVAWTWHQVVHTTLPLSEIALEAGFADQAHFTRVFKQVTRLTPSRLRRTPAARD